MKVPKKKITYRVKIVTRKSIQTTEWVARQFVHSDDFEQALLYWLIKNEGRVAEGDLGDYYADIGDYIKHSVILLEMSMKGHIDIIEKKFYPREKRVDKK